MTRGLDGGSDGRGPVEVCICTHQPRPEVLRHALLALAAQTAGPDAFRVLLVDNGSSPALEEAALAPVRAAGIEARLVREERLGLASARLRAIDETSGRWVVFLDDDNEVRADFVAEGLAFAGAQPDVGCFGGKLLLPEGTRLPRWVRDFTPYLAIKDAGDEPIIGGSLDWGRWEPPGAGAWVRRDVAAAFLSRYRCDSRILELGRRGKERLSSCEDAVMMREAVRLGLRQAYAPRLVLRHHLDPTRFRAGYLVRLLHAYGASLIRLESLVKGRVESPRYAKYYRSPWKFWLLAAAQLWRARKTSLTFGVAMVGHHWGARAAFIEAERGAAALPARRAAAASLVDRLRPKREER